MTAVQAVTVEGNPARCAEICQTDAAALIVVGDGASVLEQIKPYVEDVEVCTAGKRENLHTLPARQILRVRGQLKWRRHWTKHSGDADYLRVLSPDTAA